MEYHQIWVAAVTLLLIEGVGSIPSLYDRILFIYLVLLFKSISKDIPIAVSAADIANNNRVIAKIFISLIVIAANIKKILNPIDCNSSMLKCGRIIERNWI